MNVFALVDCNNFYASCERVFNPKMKNQPVVVLSNNDGCVIARSNEAKALNIPMGAPYFQFKDYFKQNKINVFSSNYELYGDISSRVMSTLEFMCPDIEIYSIDEAFLKLNSFNYLNLLDFNVEVKRKVKKWTGMPVSIGIAPTKTLAKIANHIAKKKTQVGVFSLCDETIREDALSQFPVASIWGVGRRLSKKLNAINIKTAKDLRDSDLKTMRKKFSVVMEKTIQELRCVTCIELEEMQPKKQIMSSRSFGKTITLKRELEEAVGFHVTKAAEKLRKQKSRASGIYLFLHTNPFSDNKKQYSNAMTCRFPEHTNDTGLMIKCAMYCLKKLYLPGFEYNKLGIMLLEIVPNTIHQQDLFMENIQSKTEKKEILMETLDKINLKMGKGTLKFCVEGYKHRWALRNNFQSPRYTTCKEEVAVVYCK